MSGPRDPGVPPICSVLIPSRKRPDRLDKTITSILASVSDPTEIEILVRADHDDTETVERFRGDPRIRELHVGDRGTGYASLHIYYEELCARASGIFIWLMNDDCTLRYDGLAPGAKVPHWDRQLTERLPMWGAIGQPEFYQLGKSSYRHAGAAFPIVPLYSWRIPEHPEDHSGPWGWAANAEALPADPRHLQHPADTYLDQRLRVEHGWKVVYLDHLCVVHDRDADDVLDKHRRF